MATTSPNAGIAAGLQQPQTTIEPPGGPFIRHSQEGRRSMYNASGITFATSGNIVTQPLSAVPGYFRKLRLKFAVSGGTGTTAVATADAPYSIATYVLLRDAFGTPLISAPGFEAFFLIPMFGGQFGMGGTRSVANLPSYSAMSKAGNFTFNTALPFEFVKGMGVISGANASLLPTLTMNIGAESTIYTTNPAGGTLALQVQNDADFYWLPEGVQVEPPGLGSTMQWIYQQCNPTFSANSTTTVQLPRLGGYISELVLEIRDSTGARVDAWPTAGNRIRLLVDGVPLIDSDISAVYDDMAIAYGIGDGALASGKLSRPTGVVAFSRRTSLSQRDEGLFDTMESYLSTNPGTLLEVQCSPWGSGGTGPYTLSVLAGQVVPAGTLTQGLPEL
jgi:hypothetical protein